MDLDRVSIGNIRCRYFLWCGQDDVWATLHLNEQGTYSPTEEYNDLEVDCPSNLFALPPYMFLWFHVLPDMVRAEPTRHLTVYGDNKLNNRADGSNGINEEADRTTSTFYIDGWRIVSFSVWSYLNGISICRKRKVNEIFNSIIIFDGVTCLRRFNCL